MSGREWLVTTVGYLEYPDRDGLTRRDNDTADAGSSDGRNDLRRSLFLQYQGGHLPNLHFTTTNGSNRGEAFTTRKQGDRHEP